MCHDARVGRHTVRAVREAQIPFGGTARTWTNTHTFTETITVKVPPGYQSQILAEQPVYRVFGDFQLLLPGDTAFVLRDTYFDTPDRNRDGIYTVTERSIDPTGQGGEVLTPVGPSTTVP